MAKPKTVNIDLSNKGFIKITHKGQEPYDNKYIHREGVCIETKRVYDEGLSVPAVIINNECIRLDCVENPSTWTPDESGLEVAIEDIEEWLTLEEGV